MAQAPRGRRFVAATIAFAVVGGGIYLTGVLATVLLRNVLLPLAALAGGWFAARVVYRAAGSD